MHYNDFSVPVLSGRFRRQPRHFAAGGFGTNFRAELVADDLTAAFPLVRRRPARVVCIKEIQSDRLVSMGASLADAEELVKREIDVWRVLSHPNVAPLLDVAEEEIVEGRAYHKVWTLVTEYYERGSLRAVLREDLERARGGERIFLTPPRIREIARGLFAGLAYLHGREPKVLHRDLKPENVCLAVTGDLLESREGVVWSSEDAFEVKLIDFGFAVELFGTVSRTALRTGTLQYKSPERAGGAYDEKDDLWAVGMILAELLLAEEVFDLFPALRGVREGMTDEAVRALLPGSAEQNAALEEALRRCEARDVFLGSLVRGLLERDPARRLSASEALRRVELAGHPVIAEDLDDMRSTMAALERRAEAAERRAEEAERRADAFESRLVALETFIRDSRLVDGPDRRRRVPEPSMPRPTPPTKRLFRLEGHTGLVVSLLSSPSRSQLISGSEDTSVRVWSTTSGERVRALLGHTGFVLSLALDPTERRLVSGSSDTTVRLWDLDTGACLRTLEGHSATVFAVAWDGSGSFVASGSRDRSVRIWDAASGALRHVLDKHSMTVNALTAHPTDDLLASGSNDTTVRVWSWSSGERIRTLAGHSREVRSLASSSTFVISGARDMTVRVWSWASGMCMRVLDGFVQCLDLNSIAWKGPVLATVEAESGRVTVWDTASPEGSSGWFSVGSIGGSASSRHGVAVLDGGRVACAAPGDSKTIVVWGE